MSSVPTILQWDTADLTPFQPVSTEMAELGAVWEIPLCDTGVFVPELPIELVAYWSRRPGDTCWDEDHLDCHPDEPCDPCLIQRYAAETAAGDPFPPIAVTYRPSNPDPTYGAWLVDDGMHRISAVLLLAQQHLPAFVFADDPTHLVGLPLSPIPPHGKSHR